MRREKEEEKNVHVYISALHSPCMAWHGDQHSQKNKSKDEQKNRKRGIFKIMFRFVMM